MHNNQQQHHVLITKQIIRQKTPQRKLINQYMKIKKIGQGNYSKIKLMTDIKTGKQYAMKKYNMFILKKKIKMGSKSGGQTKYSTQADQVYNQISIMKQLNHPNVVKLYQIMEDEEQEKIYLIMDYCQFGDVATWDHKIQRFVTKWPVKSIAKFFKQAALGLQYLHSLNIIHRDVKPQNILITQDQTAKLIDFGTAVQLKNPDQKLSGSSGTYHFMAPQTLSQVIVGGYDGKLSDIWSLGISLFACIFGYLPFNHELLIKTFEQIQRGQYVLPTKMSPQQQKFVPLIQKMLSKDWLKRPSLKQIHLTLAQIQGSV